MKPLREAVQDYLTLRRAIGFKLRAHQGFPLDAGVEPGDLEDRRIGMRVLREREVVERHAEAERVDAPPGHVMAQEIAPDEGVAKQRGKAVAGINRATQYDMAAVDPIVFHNFQLGNGSCDGDSDADDHLTGSPSVHCDSDNDK